MGELRRFHAVVDDGRVHLVLDGRRLPPGDRITWTAGQWAATLSEYMLAAAEWAEENTRRTDSRKRTIERDADGRIISLTDELAKPPPKPSARIGFRPPAERGAS